MSLIPWTKVQHLGMQCYELLSDHCVFIFYQATPLHMAAKNGDRETVKYLVEKGADINNTNVDEVSTLGLYVLLLSMSLPHF